MMSLALINLLLGGILLFNAYRALRAPLPQYTLRYTTGTHRQVTVLLLCLGLLLICVGLGLGVRASFDTWLNPPACGT